LSNLLLVTVAVHPTVGLTDTNPIGASCGRSTSTAVVVALSFSLGTRKVNFVNPPWVAFDGFTVTCAEAGEAASTSAASAPATAATPERTRSLRINRLLECWARHRPCGHRACDIPHLTAQTTRPARDSVTPGPSHASAHQPGRRRRGHSAGWARHAGVVGAAARIVPATAEVGQEPPGQVPAARRRWHHPGADPGPPF